MNESFDPYANEARTIFNGTYNKELLPDKVKVQTQIRISTKKLTVSDILDTVSQTSLISLIICKVYLELIRNYQ